MKSTLMKVLFSGSLFALFTIASAKEAVYSGDLITAVDAISFSPEDFKEPKEVFKLPENLKEWQTISTGYMESLLMTPSLRSLWQEFIDLTMPENGDFDPINVSYWENTIFHSYCEMINLDLKKRVPCLIELLGRDHSIVNVK